MNDLMGVVRVRALGAYRLHITFSDDRAGEHDFRELVAAGGQVVEPLRDHEAFARVFVEAGAPTWASGFDLDPIELHRRMAADGELGRAAA